MKTKYCWDCHGDGAKKGDLNLDPYTDDASILKASKIWGSVEYNVENWMMPPPKKTQPTPAERSQSTPTSHPTLRVRAAYCRCSRSFP